MIWTMAAAVLLVDAAQAPKPAVRARANLSEYFSTDDYPETAARRGIEGTTGFQLDIGPDGRVTNCRITSSSGDPALDSATCSVLLGRAEYSPARDVRGRAIAGSDFGRVTWRLPPPVAAPAEPFSTVRAPVRIDVTLGLDAQRRQSCAVLVNGRPGGADGDMLCAFATAGDDAALLESAPANVAMTIDVAIGLEEAMPPPVEMDRGMLLVDSTARLTVGPDGRVTNCTVTETNFHQGMPATEGIVPDLCRFPAFQGKMFTATPGSNAERRGRIRVEFHLRLGGPRSA